MHDLSHQNGEFLAITLLTQPLSPMPSPTDNSATVAIVLCTHNGEAWVSEQLRSLADQSWPVAIRVFDDASSDNTADLIESFNGELDIQCTRRTTALGLVNNFASGIQSVLDEGFQYIALCDQDDLWLPHRVEAGMRALQRAEQDPTAPDAQLVHSDLHMVDAHNHIIHESFMKWRRYQVEARKPLATVLGQNGVMGNTVLMNAKLARLALPFPDELQVHDYWLAVVAELLGQRQYLAECLVRYRIHENNVSNSSNTVMFGSNRWFAGWSFGRFKQRDFRLPFKEDTRATAVQALLEDDRFKSVNSDDRAVISAFLEYLTFNNSRWSLLISAFRHGFFRPGKRHRLRIVASLLTTRRYLNTAQTEK